MLHACIQRFDVMSTVFFELNIPLNFMYTPNPSFFKKIVHTKFKCRIFDAGRSHPHYPPDL